MTDQSDTGDTIPSPPRTPIEPATPGAAFDWLIESHRDSAPLAPLTDDLPSPFRAQPVWADGVSSASGSSPYPVPSTATLAAAPPPIAASAGPVFDTPGASPATALWDAPPPDAPVSAFTLPPVGTSSSAAEPAALQEDRVLPTASDPEPDTVRSDSSEPSAFPGAGGFGLERHAPRSRSGNGPLDWLALALAIVAAPVGLIGGLVAVIVGTRRRGYAASAAKAAIGIGAVLTLVLGVALVVHDKVAGDQAAHDAIVASSARYCAKLRSDPSTLTSDTFGWPAPTNTIPDSIAAMQAYEAKWESIASVAPTGIRADTARVAATAKSIITSVQATQTLDNANNIIQLQNVVSTTGIKAWAHDYCGEVS